MSDKYASNVVALFGFNGSNGDTSMVDESAAARTWTAAGNAQLSTVQFKFGTAALALDGSGDYITFASHTDWAVGSDDFTLEMWVWQQSGQISGDRNLLCVSVSGGISAGLQAGKPYCGPNGVSYGPIAAAPIATNQWVHVAFCKAAGTMRVFANGVIVAAAADAFTYAQAAAGIGVASLGPGFGSPQNFFSGYIDEFRLTKSVARYTAAFTPPRGPFSRRKNAGNAANRPPPIVITR